MSEIERIYIDMDGVLADFVSAAFVQCGKTPVENVPWNFYEQWGLTEDEFWATVDRGGIAFWDSIKPYSWMWEVITACQTTPWYICSAPSDSIYCEAGKKSWLKRTFGQGFRDYHFTRLKHHLASPRTLLIDDNDDKVRKFREAGGAAVLFPQSWNGNHYLTSQRIPYLQSEIESLTGVLA